MNTAPQKESTGAPVSSWLPYQTAATSSAVASSATMIAITRMPEGRAGAPGPEPPAGLLPGSTGSAPRLSAGSEGSSGALDTLAQYRT